MISAMLKGLSNLIRIKLGTRTDWRKKHKDLQKKALLIKAPKYPSLLLRIQRGKSEDQ
jgi:hypothetical protein